MRSMIVWVVMKIAIRPPEYWPRIPYLALMQSVDMFILADTFQYSRQSFQNRARLRTADGWSWISVPLLGRQHGRPITETQIDGRAAWASKHQRALRYNYGGTPYFGFFEDRVNASYRFAWENLGALTCASTEILHDLFDLPCSLVRASNLQGAPSTVAAIVDVVRPSTLIALPETRFRDQLPRVDMMTFRFTEPVYRQRFEGFEPNMTSLDVLCNYGPEAASILSAGVEESHD